MQRYFFIEKNPLAIHIIDLEKSYNLSTYIVFDLLRMCLDYVVNDAVKLAKLSQIACITFIVFADFFNFGDI